MTNGKGALWRNKRGKHPKAPQFTGQLETPDGKKWFVSGWTADGQAGRPVLNITCTEFVSKVAETVATEDYDDDAPF